jgi:hypothetical protein
VGAIGIGIGGNRLVPAGHGENRLVPAVHGNNRLVPAVNGDNGPATVGSAAPVLASGVGKRNS